MNEIIPRATIHDICGHREKTLAAYKKAYESLVTANDFLLKATDSRNFAAPTSKNRYNAHLKAEKVLFTSPVKLAKEEDYLEQARKIVDTDIWAHIFDVTNLGQLMDKKSKDEFSNSLMVNPPEATEENIYATLQTAMAQSDDIFARGMAECFSNLDRRFKSHDGWKIGSRVILNNAMGSFGCWNYHMNHRDTITDVERVFYILDGKQPPLEYGGDIVAKIENTRRGLIGAKQSETETEYFKARIFLNGNLHLWFKRKDLVEKVNKLLGEYYGSPLCYDDSEEDHSDPLSQPKTAIAKNFAFFPTPDKVVERVIGEVSYRMEGKRVLEPSAGSGQLSKACVANGGIVDCIEIQPGMANDLRNSGLYNKVICSDFLMVSPVEEYELVVMNPPFDRERDIDHVCHALKFLKKGGTLVSIMSASTEFRETKKAEAFRKMVDKEGGRFYDLPARSFSECGTNVNTIILTIHKKG